VREWFNRAVSKTAVSETVPEVRILPLPPKINFEIFPVCCRIETSVFAEVIQKIKQMEKNRKSASVSMLGAKFIDPEGIISRLGFENGMRIANFGCGTGYFSFSIAKKVGPDGIVWALDVLPQKIEVVESQAKLLGITNIITKRVNLENEKGSGLSKESADWVILVNMLFQNSNKDAILAETKRVLKNTGKILLIEWDGKNMFFGPKKDIKISKREMLEIARKNNLEVASEIETSNFHYGLILKKQR
jgi:ubiquinone/menaquinone biosynthesis C-methylase UbiE